MRCKSMLIIPILLVFGALATACSSATPSPTLEPTATSTAEPAVTSTPDGEGHSHISDDPAIQAGYDIYVASGCGACHGQEGEGSDIAPGLPGHSSAQVFRQIRAPVGIMPPYDTSQISEEDLANLVAFVESLEGGHHHSGASSRNLGEELEMHHWMALTSIEDGNIEETRHHITHIIELTEGAHQALMQQMLADLEAGGELHDVSHGIEEMLAGVLETGGASVESMHLRLAMSSLLVSASQSAIHHLEHFGEVVESHEQEEAQTIITAIQDSHIDEAADLLMQLMEEHGVSTSADQHDDMDMHEEDAHAEETTEDGHMHDEGEADAGSELQPIEDALEAIRAGDLEGAAGHIEMYIASASGVNRIRAQEALNAVNANNLHDAQDILGEILGVSHSH